MQVQKPLFKRLDSFGIYPLRIRHYLQNRWLQIDIKGPRKLIITSINLLIRTPVFSFYFCAHLNLNLDLSYYNNIKMTIITIASSLFFLFFIHLALNGKIQCQHQPSKWIQGKALKLSQRESLISTIYGVDLIVDDLDEYISRIIKQKGLWQPVNLRNMVRFVAKGSTFLNIGSHIGIEAVVIGKLIGNGGKMYIIQPFGVSYNIVLKNIHLNDLDQFTTVYKVGASNKYSKGIMSVKNSNTAGGNIYTDPTVAQPPLNTEQVYVDLVDNIIPKDAIIDFALIDVQRLQVECLQGMKQTILRSPNIVIMCEWANMSFNTKDIQKKKEQLLKWFMEHKFKFYQLRLNYSCKLSSFFQMSFDSIKNLREMIDIFFVPSHINPNTIDY